MSNKRQVLDKISRNLDQLEISNSRSGDDVVAGGLTVSYVDADIQKPLGGVDGDVNPFLGIGVGNPGVIKVKGAAGENSIAAILDSAENLQIMSVIFGHANDVVMEEGDTTDELARIRGQVDLLGMGM